MRTFSDSEITVPLRPLRIRVAKGTAAFVLWTVVGFGFGIGALVFAHHVTTCTAHETK